MADRIGAWPPRTRILLLAFPNAQMLDIAGPLQMFAGGNVEVQRRAYCFEIAAPQAGPFATSSGARLFADLAFADITNRRLARTDTLIVVGGNPACGKSSRVSRSPQSCPARSAACGA